MKAPKNNSEQKQAGPTRYDDVRVITIGDLRKKQLYKLIQEGREEREKRILEIYEEQVRKHFQL